MGRNQHTLPVFPLANVALFPRVRTPLHIFEPRYRQLTEYSLAGDRRIVMAVVLPDCAGQMADDPPVFPVACAGVIRDSQRLPDGRFNLLLLGMQRVRIVEEAERPPHRLFRLAVVETLEDPCDPAEAPRLTAMRSRTMGLVRELLADASEPSARFASSSFRNVDDSTFVNALCCLLPFPPLEKQGLLEADGIAARFERLIEVLSFSLASGEGRRPSNSGSFH